MKYGDTRDFSEELAAVFLNRKWGFVDKNGDVVIPFIYDGDKDFFWDTEYVFKNGKANVKEEGKWFYIDKQGNRVDE